MEKTEINQRFIKAINSLLQDKGLTKSGVAQSLGIKPAKFSEILNNRMNVGTDTLALLCNLYSFNATWLLLGEGYMLIPGELKGRSKKAIAIPKVTEFPEEDGNNEEMRPRIPFDAAAGSLSIALGSVNKQDCEHLPIIPTFPKYDFTIITRGDSMLPDFHSGDELACAFVKESSFIQWGRVHVLDTAQGIVLKKIFDGKKNIVCKSINKEYPDFEVPKDEIYHIAIVVGLIRHF